MENLKFKPVRATVITAVLLLIVFIVSIISNTSAIVASWVQAVGALIIIAVTALIAGRQSREARQRELDAQKQLHESVANISRSCYMAFLSLHKSSQSLTNGPQTFYPSEFEAARYGLASIPLHQLGDGILIENVLRILGMMGYTSAILSNAIDRSIDPRIAFTAESLNSQRTMLFNAHANIWRTVYGSAGEDALRLE